MANAPITVSGQIATAIEVNVPAIGPWFADVDLANDDKAIAGRVEIVIGETLRLSGTVDPRSTGTFGRRQRARIIGGAGGWQSLLAARHYHNDAGVRARSVAEDAAREAAETIGSFAAAAERLGADYVRTAGAASRALEDAAGGADWWVAYDGTTHVGARLTSPAPAGAYEVLTYDPRHREVVMAIDDLTAITIGSVLTDRLDSPLTVRSLEIAVTDKRQRVTAWVADGSRTQMLDSMRQIVGALTSDRVFGCYRYRVVAMTVDRVNVQAVRKVAGLPDLLAIDMWPGVAGVHAQLTPGAEVLVEFIEGDRKQPIITQFVGKGGTGHVPVTLSLCGGTQAAARQGDLTQSGGPGCVVTLVPVGSPVGAPPNNAVAVGVPHYISFSPVPPTDFVTGSDCKPVYGNVSTGNPKVLE